MKVTHFLTIMVIGSQAYCQNNVLRSVEYGLDLIYGDKSKEEIILSTRFDSGVDEQIAVIRFDNVGTGSGIFFPLIISTSTPVQSDSLGLYPLKVDSLLMNQLLEIVQRSDTHAYERPSAKPRIFRVTWRSRKKYQQYYLPFPIISVEFFQLIETKLSEKKGAALEIFYSYLYYNRLIDYSSSGKVEWIW